MSETAGFGFQIEMPTDFEEKNTDANKITSKFWLSLLRIQKVKTKKKRDSVPLGIIHRTHCPQVSSGLFLRSSSTAENYYHFNVVITNVHNMFFVILVN